MRSPILVTLTVCAMLLASCGRVDFEKKQATTPEDEALGTLMEVPLETGGRNVFGRTSSTSAQSLDELIQQWAREKKFRVPIANRSAVGSSGQVDLSQLNNLFALLQGGQANSITSLAQGLVSMNGGNAASTGSKLSGILGMLQMIAPLIAIFAPQFAPIITALTTILPLVLNMFSTFRKPKAPTTSAANIRFATIV